MDKIKKKLIFFMPSMEGGGVEKNLIILSNYFAKRKIDIYLITFDNKFNQYFNRKIKIINVKKHSKKKFTKYYKYLRCLILLVKEIILNKNIVVFSFQANIYAIILSFFLNFTVISRSNSSPSGWKSNLLKKNIFKFFYKYANEIIVNSKNFQREFKKNFNIKPIMIYNPLNKKYIKDQSKKKIKFDFFDNKKDLKIINIGRFTEQKNQITLLRSFKIVLKKRKAKLLIIGYGSNKSKLREFIKSEGLIKNVLIMDFQKNPYAYLIKADLFVLTSKYEGLPNVLLESQVLKKYVISTNCPTGPSEILMKGKLGDLFKIDDYNELAKKIILFKKNSSFTQKKINLAYKNLRRFDYYLNCQKYLEIIKKYL